MVPYRKYPIYAISNLKIGRKHQVEKYKRNQVQCGARRNKLLPALRHLCKRLQTLGYPHSISYFAAEITSIGHTRQTHRCNVQVVFKSASPSILWGNCHLPLFPVLNSITHQHRESLARSSQILSVCHNKNDQTTQHFMTPCALWELPKSLFGLLCLGLSQIQKKKVFKIWGSCVALHRLSDWTPVWQKMANLNIAPMLHIQSIFSTQVSSLELSSSAEVFSLKALVAVVFPALANKASSASEMEAFHFGEFKI